MNFKEVALIITGLMAIVGLGGVVLEYYYDVGLNTALHLFAFGGIGVIGFILSVYIIRENMRNWYWHEVKKEHVIAFLVFILIMVGIAWHYGVFEWFL